MILAIDVGKGTEDTLILNSTTFENSIQLVLPSMAQILYNKLAHDTSNIIYSIGNIIAGEPWHKIIYEKAITKSVVMTEQAARSLRYNLNQVKKRGIKILSQEEVNQRLNSYKISSDYYQKLDAKTSLYILSDIHWARLFSNIMKSGLKISDITTVLLCCQDHGEPKDQNRSVRDFRIQAIYGKLLERGKFEDLLFRSDEISDYLPRHQSIAIDVNNRFPHIKETDIFVMDSSPSVILGAIQTKLENNHQTKYKIFANVGNGHTLIALLENNLVIMVYELHTGGLKPTQLIDQLQLLLSGNLSHQDVLDSGGHGVFFHSKFRKFTNQEITKILSEPIIVIGPNRAKLRNLNVRFIHPGGSMMMAGPIGLVHAFNHQD